MHYWITGTRGAEQDLRSGTELETYDENEEAFQRLKHLE
jgi:hypothetical protein